MHDLLVAGCFCLSALCFLGAVWVARRGRSAIPAKPERRLYLAVVRVDLPPYATTIQDSGWPVRWSAAKAGAA